MIDNLISRFWLQIIFHTSSKTNKFLNPLYHENFLVAEEKRDFIFHSKV